MIKMKKEEEIKKELRELKMAISLENKGLVAIPKLVKLSYLRKIDLFEEILE